MNPLPAKALPPSPPLPEIEPEFAPCLDGLITEDQQPVERILVEKLYRLLTHPLYACWPGPGPGRTFLVLANVGWFFQDRNPALVPDCLLSLDVTCPENLHVKQGHSYYQWAMGKAPDVVIEVVSDRSGGEDTFKMSQYARQRVPYYAIYDPDHHLSPEPLRTFAIIGGKYCPVDPGPWPLVGLGLRLWRGAFEGVEETWLRWCDAQGEIIPTAEEQATWAKEEATQAADRATRAEQRVRELEEELRRLKGEPPSQTP